MYLDPSSLLKQATAQDKRTMYPDVKESVKGAQALGFSGIFAG